MNVSEDIKHTRDHTDALLHEIEETKQTMQHFKDCIVNMQMKMQTLESHVLSIYEKNSETCKHNVICKHIEDCRNGDIIKYCGICGIDDYCNFHDLHTGDEVVFGI
jgi:hypothetical protein